MVLSISTIAAQVRIHSQPCRQMDSVQVLNTKLDFLLIELSITHQLTGGVSLCPQHVTESGSGTQSSGKWGRRLPHSSQH